MPSKTFEISIRQAERRLVSTIQHKLRVVLKCYTIVNFNTEDNQMFTFNKTHRIRGITIKDSKDYSGFYNLEKKELPIEDSEYILSITVN